MDYLKQGETRDYGVLFLNDEGDLFDPTDPTYEISHYVKNGTITWVQDVSESALFRIDLGHYAFTWFVDENIYEIDETYYIRFRGTDPDTSIRNIEERVARIIHPNSGGGGDICQSNIVARFVF